MSIKLKGICMLSRVCICLCLVAWVHSVQAWQTTGDYDEQVVQLNEVDFTAAGSSMTVAEFSQRVEGAFLVNAGGVIDGSILGSTAVYGVDQTKALNFDTGDLGIGALRQVCR